MRTSLVAPGAIAGQRIALPARSFAAAIPVGSRQITSLHAPAQARPAASVIGRRHASLQVRGIRQLLSLAPIYFVMCAWRHGAQARCAS